MNEDFAQRRRVAVALAITVILVPAAFLLNRGSDDSGDPTVATLVGTVQIDDATADAQAGSTDDGAQATDPMGSTPVAYLDGTVPPQAGDPAMIAIPRRQESLAVTATFSNAIDDPATCQIRDVDVVPFSATVTVKNLDNSRSVQCIASIGGVQPDEGVVLGAEAFLQIGDLTDAPLAVEITW